MCCAKEKTSYKTAMNWRCWAIALIASSLVGCGIGRVITAPVRYVFNKPEPAPATNTSDVTNPGQPVTIPSPTPRVASRKSSRSTSRIAGNQSPAKPSPSREKAANAQFPVAKPVPGKPGLVFSPFNASGGYIDVSGYAPGSKVKDPSTQQIFIVP
jgi:hypothetical protein